MRVPERLEPLLEHGTIEEVLRPLQSGKEAEVYLVMAGGEERVAKVYKNAQFRSFQHRAEYTEGRRVRSSREQRAMNKQSRHGREKTEDAWRSAEVDAIHALRRAGVRVPAPYVFTDGVLVMELVRGADGMPAPRLVDTHFTAEEATEVFQILLRETVKMLCAGIVHADLSDFNVLMSDHGPVIIDFPQAIDPAANQNAGKLLIRDVNNITSFLGRFAPHLKRTQYGPEMWDLYERNELDPDTELTGRYEPKKKKAEVSSLLEDILELEREARERREALGLPAPRRARRPIIREQPAPRKPQASKQGQASKHGQAPKQGQAPKHGQAPRHEQGPNHGQAPTNGQPPADPNGPNPDAPRKRRRRRGRGKGPPQDGGAVAASPSRPPDAPRAAAPPHPSPTTDGDAPPRRRRRRRRRGGGGGGGTPTGDASGNSTT